MLKHNLQKQTLPDKCGTQLMGHDLNIAFYSYIYEPGWLTAIKRRTMSRAHAIRE